MNDFYYRLWDDYRGSYRISPNEAVQIALQYIPYQLVEIGLGLENEILVYKVTVRTPIGMYEVNIDTRTGDVVGIRRKRG